MIEQKQPHAEISLRAALKGIRQIGIPPASLVRHLESMGKCCVDSPICYGFTNELSDFQYFRMEIGDETEGLETMKRLLRARVPCVFGMSIPSSMTLDPRIELRKNYDTVEGNTAGILCGFDDSYRMASTGAFLFTGLFPKTWGEDGYGWMSYSFIRHKMITDLWIVMRPQWLRQLATDRGIALFDETRPEVLNRSNGSRFPKVCLDQNHLR